MSGFVVPNLAGQQNQALPSEPDRSRARISDEANLDTATDDHTAYSAVSFPHIPVPFALHSPLQYLTPHHFSPRRKRHHGVSNNEIRYL